jgi:hypothetical protein
MPCVKVYVMWQGYVATGTQHTVDNVDVFGKGVERRKESMRPKVRVKGLHV